MKTIVLVLMILSVAAVCYSRGGGGSHFGSSGHVGRSVWEGPKVPVHDKGYVNYDGKTKVATHGGLTVKEDKNSGNGSSYISDSYDWSIAH